MKTTLLSIVALALSAEGAPIVFDSLPAPTNVPTVYWFRPRLKAEAWRGKPCEFEVTAKGDTGVALRLYIETTGKKFRATPMRMRLRDGVERTCRVGVEIPDDATEIRPRIDFQTGKGKAEIVRARFGRMDDFEPLPRTFRLDAYELKVP